MVDRPPIPEPIKREVRQACGFGCVMCGLPIYQIDHIQDYAEVNEHTENNLALLCGTHHQMKTSGLLTRDQIAAAKAAPFNLRAGQTTPFPIPFQFIDHSNVEFGEVAFTANFSNNQVAYPIVIQDLPLVTIRVEDGNVLFTLQLYDNTNEKVLEIIDNELTFSTEVWDATFIGRTLTLRNQPRSLIMQIRFTPGPPPLISIFRCNLFFMGWNVTVNSNGGLSIIRPNGTQAPVFTGLTFNMSHRLGAFLLGACPSYDQNHFMLGYQ